MNEPTFVEMGGMYSLRAANISLYCSGVMKWRSLG